MTEKETMLRSVLFLVVGILLLLSLVICIYVVSQESDLVPIESVVTNITKDSGTSGKNQVYVTYEVDGSSYNYAFNTKKDYQVGDKINIYYHSKQVTSVQLSRTSKLIFICPLIGLGLCALGLYELFKKNNREKNQFKTTAIGVIGNTEELKIINEEPSSVPKPEPATVATEPETVPVTEPKTEPKVEKVEETKKEEEIEMPQEKEVSDVQITDIYPKEEVTTPKKDLSSSIVEKVEKTVNDKKIEVSEDELKDVIKGVLAEVIQEVKEDKPKEPVVQQKVIPNYYYISGTTLIYEEAGKEKKELELKTIKSVVRTINKAGNVVKVTVSNDAVKCILTNMKNIDLGQVADLLKNKLSAMDDSFKEEIEHKEY